MRKEMICEKIEEIIFQHYSIRLNSNSILMGNGFDSVSIIELIMIIEDEFDIEFESSKLNYSLLKSIHTISEYIYHTINGEIHE